MAPTATSELEPASLEPLRLVGSFCDWKLESALLCFERVGAHEDWSEYRLCFQLQSDTLEFQVCSGQCGFEWRLFPKLFRDLTAQKSADAARQGFMRSMKKWGLNAQVGGKHDGHGKNFRVQGAPGAVLTVCLLLHKAEKNEAGVWYLAEGSGARVSIGAAVGPPLNSDGEIPEGLNLDSAGPKEIGDLCIVGSMNSWKIGGPRAQLFRFETLRMQRSSQSGATIVESQVRFRVHDESVQFQVASEKLGFGWHLYHRGISPLDTVGEVPLGRGPGQCMNGTPGIRGFLGGAADGHEKNFIIRADLFTVVTVFLFLVLPEGFPECGAEQLESFLTYAVEDAGRPRLCKQETQQASSEDLLLAMLGGDMSVVPEDSKQCIAMLQQVMEEPSRMQRFMERVAVQIAAAPPRQQQSLLDLAALSDPAKMDSQQIIAALQVVSSPESMRQVMAFIVGQTNTDAEPVQGTWLQNEARWTRVGRAAIGTWVSSIADDRWGTPDELGPANLLGGSGFWRAEWKCITDQWFIVDLGTPTCVTAVRVKGDPRQPKKSPKDMIWQHSGSRNSDWFDAVAFTGADDGGQVEIFLTPPVTSRWWRLYVVDTYGNGGRNQDMLLIKGFGIQVKAEQRTERDKQEEQPKRIFSRSDYYPRPFSLEQEWACRDARRAPLRTLDTMFCRLAAEALQAKAHCKTSGLLDGGVLCISLPQCRERRAHTRQELFDWGFPEPHFLNASGPDDRDVLEWFNSDHVLKYPPCFRCRDPGTGRCDCDNNVLLLEQIANWMSFRKAWRIISQSTKEWTLLIEDDVKFTHRAGEVWNALITKELLDKYAGSPCMIRCGWQLGYAYVDDAPPELAENVVRMSNHCSILNRSMAKALLEESEHLIDTTSDLFAHELVAPRHRHFTFFPPISYDLSFARKVPSLIRPKGLEEDNHARSAEVAKAQRVDPRQIRAWLKSLTWAPYEESDEDDDDQSNERSRSGLIWELRTYGEPLASWSDLDNRNDRKEVQLEGRYVVLDSAPPPEWVYAGRCLFVGDESRRPRGFLPILQLQSSYASMQFAFRDKT